MLVDAFEPILDLEKSHGSWIIDACEGNEYVDFFSFYASMPLGMNHPKINNDEMIRYLGRIAVNKPTNSDIYTPEMAEFVETFARFAIPQDLPYLFLVSGGAVAVANLLKMAFDWKVRKNIQRGLPANKGQQVIHFKRCFHGRTGYTLSMTDSIDPTKTQYFPKLDWPRITCPAVIFPLSDRNVEKAKTIEAKAIAEIKQALIDNPDDVAALIIEPIQGEGGDNHFRPEFFRQLRKLADENEFLLLVDEFQTGMGLTGTFWAYPQMGIAVDGLAFGKKMQVCGILGSRRLDEVEDHVFKVSGRINSTWGGNLLDMVRCRLILEIMQEENTLEHVRREGEYLIQRLEGLKEEFGGRVSNVRGRGLMCAFDLESAAARNELRKLALDERLIILGCGRRTIRFRTALNIPREALDEGFERLTRALRRLPATGTSDT
jgi:L-lysine 6-transaminase